jgi:hypothetical protein
MIMLPVLLLAALIRPPIGVNRAKPVCYRLRVETGADAFGPRDHRHGLPSVIRLDTVPAIHGGWRVEPNISFRPPAAFPGTPRWSVVGDSIDLLWSNGYAVTTLTLGSEHDGVRAGTAMARSDAVVPESNWPRASVRATAVACPHS